MNELLSDVRFWFTAMALGLLSLVKVLWNKQERRFEALEASVVRRKEFDQLRADFQEKHDENGVKIDGGFTRIESLIERNHEDAVEGRNRVGNQIMNLVEKVGRVEGRLGIDEYKVRKP